MYAQDLKVCMEAMELAFERMRWDYVEAFEREGLDLDEIPDDLHDASKAMQKVKEAMRNCNELLHDVERTNAKKRFEERQNARRKSKKVN
jgi:predicted component of type VI protein secretion system